MESAQLVRLDCRVRLAALALQVRLVQLVYRAHKVLPVHPALLEE